MSTINTYANQKLMTDSYKQLSTGSKINSAADDAAGLAISEKLASQANGYAVGTDNALDMQNMLKTAEGGLNSISDSLSRIHELSIQAQNGTYTDGEKAILQQEVDQLLSGIKDSAQSTQFNKIKLLDGSVADANMAANPDGRGMKINIANASLEALGIDGYDVTGDFDISQIENAMDMVNEARSKIGAQSNTIDRVVSSNETARVNLETANSRIADTDVALAVMDMSRARIVEQMQVFTVKQQQEQAQNKINILGQI